MFRIAVLISGSGSNLQAIISAIRRGILPNVSIVMVIADRPCSGLQKATKANIPNILLDRAIHDKDLDEKIISILDDSVDLIVLAGFLSILSKSFIKRYKNKIINIHPSLLPKYGGAGMYGLKVHRAVLEAGEKQTGCTVHYVDAGIDTGKIINQAKVLVTPEDTPEILQKRVLVQEHLLLPLAIAEISEIKT